MKNKLLSLLKYAIGWPLSLVAFVFIFKIFLDQAPTLLPNLQHINWFLLGIGIFCLVVYYFFRSIIWHQLIEGFSYKISYRESSYLWAMSEMRRYIPGKVWLVLGRTVMFGKHGVDKKDTGKALIIEMELFVLGCLVISLFALPFILPNLASIYTLLIVLAVLLIVGIYIFHQSILHFLTSFWGEGTTTPESLAVTKDARTDSGQARMTNKHSLGNKKSLTTKLKTVLHFLLPSFSAQYTFRLIVLSIAGLLFFGLGNYFVITAVFTLDAHILFPLVGVFVLAFLTGFLSFIAPSGLGVREGVVLYSLMQLTTSGLAAFGAVFSRIMLVAAELLFILWSYVLRRTKNRFVLNSLGNVRKHPQVSIVAFLSFIAALYLTATSFLRYDHYYTGRFDLGNMAQTVWNSMHGNLFLFTNPDSTEIVSRLAFHADVILVLLAPFYALWQDPRMLLLIQAVVTVIGAFFVYAIARDVLKSKNLGVTFAFAYLINPSIQRVVLYDFHAVALATTFFLASFYFMIKKRFWLMTLFLVLAALTKEQVWLIVSLFGFVVLIGYRKYFLGGLLAVGGVGIFYYLISYLIPQFSTGVEHFALGYFVAFGDTPGEVLRTIFLSPGTVVQTIWTPTRIEYFEQIFSPFGFLSFLFPFWLIFAGPDLGINLLSNNTQLHQIYYQYTATITPFIIISAIYGVWVLQKINDVWLKGAQSKRAHYSFGVFVGCYLFGMAIYTAYLYGPLPGARWENIHMFTKPLANKQFVDNYLAQIPQSAKVSASNSLGSHLTHRDYLYTVPVGIDRADVVVLLLDDEKSKETLALVRRDPHLMQVAHDGNFYAFKKKRI